MKAVDEGFERGREGRIVVEDVALMCDAFLRGGGVFACVERVVDCAQVGRK